jgi:hypothetical protein
VVGVVEVFLAQGLSTAIQQVIGPRRAIPPPASAGKGGKDAGGVTERLQDPDLEVCLEAAYAIWKIVGKTDPGLPVLIKALEPAGKLNELNRTKAVYVLGEIGPEAKAALPPLSH